MKNRIRRRPAAGEEKPEATLSYGDEFGPYVITGFAGSGATSYVYRARRRDNFDPVAIKMLHPHLVADPTRKLTFYREARIMMRMDHPNVVRFQEIIEEGDTLAFVMEYVDGPTLDEWRKQRAGDIDEVALANVFVDVLRGVTAAHREGVVHRDMKPGNIMVTEVDGRSVAKIIDFGVARFADQPLTERERSKIVGTAAYISPEEVSKPEKIGRESDLYSIGVMLYEAACGKRPFEKMTARDLLKSHALETPEKPSRVNPDISRSLESVIMQTLHKRPEGRFSSAPEMIGALERALHGGRKEATASSVDPLEAMETTVWRRPSSTTDVASKSGGLGTFFRRCLEAASVLIPATGAEDGRDRSHYLNRTPDPGMPFR